MPFGHRHREQEEVYVVVSGSGRAKLDDKVIELAQWDVLRVAPRVIRAFEAGPDGLEVICIGGPRPKGGEPAA
jgi:mannose-6-phosphate isomerase-like protein (cupin superfamily)